MSIPLALLSMISACQLSASPQQVDREALKQVVPTISGHRIGERGLSIGHAAAFPVHLSILGCIRGDGGDP